MKQSRGWRDVVLSDVGILILLALVKLIFHTLTNGAHGFHRDELALLDDARYLDWGFVAYPPITPFIARIGLELFGASLIGIRFFAALSQSITFVIAGLIARELGGNRHAQIIAAVAVAITPVSMSMNAMLMYVAYDYLWWVLLAYLVIRLLKSNDARWWLGIGAVIGLGMMTKFTMGFLVAGIVAGTLLTPTRQHLKSKWLWSGVALSVLVFLPNMLWQIQHNFISLEFLGDIHARDIRIGRTENFLPDQFLVAVNPLTVPLALIGLAFYFFDSTGKNFRMIGWMAVVTFAIFWLAQGRGYYTGPIYPMLLTAGAVSFQRWIESLSNGRARVAYGIAWSLLISGGAFVGLIALPLVPVNSPMWETVNSINGEFREQIGWTELTQTVAEIYNALPASEKARAGILAGNYGEAGAINLYGAAYGLPKAISGINSYWLRGYGEPPPETVVVVGMDFGFMTESFQACARAGQITNKFGILNEETRDHPNIYVCRGLRQPWHEFWKKFRYFG
ncbi:MAG: glycosyltransferase family 39 protein [Chloroflexi bacterium]|nr:glycosyltransferase family 39 protein [Chloroflexota bacterium]